MTVTEEFEGRLLSAGEMPAPGGWRSALYRPDAPGAVLDGQPFAASWPAFMRAITNPNDAGPRQYIANAMAERIPNEGGFLVPENLRSQVLTYMTRSLIRPYAMVLPMSSHRLAIPTLDNLSQASGTQALGGFQFAWTEEGAGITPSTPSFGRTVLEARKVTGYLQNVPNEFCDDAAGAFGDFMAATIARGYAWFEDDYALNGTGIGEMQGLINAPCAVAVTRTTGGTIVQADLQAMLNALHPASLQDGMRPEVTSVQWLVSAHAFQKLLALYLSIGTPANQAVGTSTWLNLGDGHEVAPSLLGLPLAMNDHQPAVGTAGDIILADLSNYVIADRMAMTIERAGKGVSFVSGGSDFRVKSRLDGRYWIQSATTTVAGQSVSPVVVLH